MEPIDKQAPNTSPDGKVDVVAEALQYARRAQELRSAAIEQLLEQRTRIENDLKTLGYVLSSNGNGHRPERGSNKVEPPGTPQRPAKRFEGLTLAAIGRTLLIERGTLHGKEIEKLAKAGGFKGGTKNFQNYMPVAFKREGGFKNIGGNKWTLDESVPPKR